MSELTDEIAKVNTRIAGLGPRGSHEVEQLVLYVINQAWPRISAMAAKERLANPSQT